MMAIGSSGLYQNRKRINNGSSELYSREKIFKKTSTGGSLKAACLGEGQAVAREGFGDGLLTSIEYRLSAIAGSFVAGSLVALAKEDGEEGQRRWKHQVSKQGNF